MAIPKYVFLFFVVIYKQFPVQKSLFTLNNFLYITHFID